MALLKTGYIPISYHSASLIQVCSLKAATLNSAVLFRIDTELFFLLYLEL